MISRRNSLQIFGLLISILLTGVGVYGILLQFRTGTTVGDELIRQILLLGEGAFAIIGSLFLMLFLGIHQVQASFFYSCRTSDRLRRAQTPICRTFLTQLFISDTCRNNTCLLLRTVSFDSCPLHLRPFRGRSRTPATDHHVRIGFLHGPYACGGSAR